MLKIEKDYLEEYGDIPTDTIGRLNYLISNFKTLRPFKGKIISRLKECLNREWEEIEYTLYLVPKATPRPRASFSSRVFYVKGASDHKKLFKRIIKDIDYKMIFTPCEFYCTTYHPIPKTMNAVEQVLAELGYIRPTSKPDFDNLAKTYSDMIQGILLDDDAYIIKGVSEKYYSVKPRIEIKLRYMKEFDSVYNKKKIERKVDKP